MSIANFIRDSVLLPRLKQSGCLVVYDADQRYHKQCFGLVGPKVRVVDASESSIESREAALLALNGTEPEESALRRFEKRLLEELGYGLELAQTNEGTPIVPGMFYRFKAESGPQPCVAEAPGAVYGKSLADLDAERFADQRSLRDAKRVLRTAIDACLEGRALKSREVLLALRRRRQ